MLVHTSAIVYFIGEPGVWGDPYLSVLRAYSQVRHIQDKRPTCFPISWNPGETLTEDSRTFSAVNHHASCPILELVTQMVEDVSPPTWGPLRFSIQTSGLYAHEKKGLPSEMPLECSPSFPLEATPLVAWGTCGAKDQSWGSCKQSLGSRYVPVYNKTSLFNRMAWGRVC